MCVCVCVAGRGPGGTEPWIEKKMKGSCTDLLCAMGYLLFAPRFRGGRDAHEGTEALEATIELCETTHSSCMRQGGDGDPGLKPNSLSPLSLPLIPPRWPHAGGGEQSQGHLGQLGVCRVIQVDLAGFKSNTPKELSFVCRICRFLSC